MTIDYSRFDNIDTSSSEEEDSTVHRSGDFGYSHDDIVMRPSCRHDNWADSQQQPQQNFAPHGFTDDGWLKVGHVLVHPDDKNYMNEYPSLLFTDPSDYADSIVESWH